MTFAVGDRVRVKKKNADYAGVDKGDEGYVVDIDEEQTLPLSVEMGDERQWYFQAESVELVSGLGLGKSTGPHLHFESALPGHATLAELAAKYNVRIETRLANGDVIEVTPSGFQL